MFLSLVAAGGFATLAVQHYLSAATIVTAATVAVFTAIIAFLIYGNLGYQLARLGYWQRVGAREQNIANSTQSFTKATAPSLTILVPAYKEEASVIRQTVLSAALQVYPQKRVVLLIDDPPEPRMAEDRQALEAARRVPVEIHALFAEPRQHLQEAYSAFLCRLQQGELEVAQEAISLAEQHRFAAAWFDEQADGYPSDSHTDRWFIEHMLRAAREEHCMAAMRWESEAENSGYCDKLGQESMFELEYGRLLSIFDVDLSSFERKQYRNLSHEPNKAMNLNSYLGLMGRRVRLVQRGGECELADSARGARAIDIPDTAYVITLDADSVLLRHYAETLIAWMEQPEHARIAVTQTPYSAFPDAPGLLEQTAGATTDIQYLVHQGFTRYGATFWVGANALLRKAALDDVCERSSDGWVCRYIQDHTVIEDTESTVDLLRHGWQLFNHPERLAYSATPSDFASLIIQRGRWANGGLLIIPKLLAYWRTIKASRQSLAQAFYQFHYLTSLALSPVCLLLLLLVPFPNELNTAWIPLAALPFAWCPPGISVRLGIETGRRSFASTR
jgi:cellulose synthase/poly-beta-1,6-N-acetylglucosamine synthase-like glycosyltransferase